MKYIARSFAIVLLMTVHLWGEAAAALSREVEVVLTVGGSGPRPYVALWIETKEGAFVRTLQVWGDKPKYQRELRAWKSAGGVDADGISGATRPNGAYRVRWDGLGAEGRPLPAGEYVFRAECVREEGGRSQVKVTLPQASDPVAVSSPRDGDILSLELKTAPAAESRP